MFQRGAELIDWLAPRPGERILDLGCGTGHLTARLSETGVRVVGLDASREMLGQARRRHPNLAWVQCDARRFAFGDAFDAVFSNAALHWIPESESVVRCIAAALKQGGRFVTEFGGRGNVQRIVAAIQAAVDEELGAAARDVSPWYYPSVGQYSGMLERFGLEVRQATLFDRPTPLEDGELGMRNWLTMFCKSCFRQVTESRREEVMARAEDRLRPQLFDGKQWMADYRRLRILAVRS